MSGTMFPEKKTYIQSMSLIQISEKKLIRIPYTFLILIVFAITSSEKCVILGKFTFQKSTLFLEILYATLYLKSVKI